MKLTYGAIEGSRTGLRVAVAALYDEQDARATCWSPTVRSAPTTCVHLTLVEPGDHVVSVLPDVPAALLDPREHRRGRADPAPARGERVASRPRRARAPSSAGGAKLVAINNPNNPTGSLMDRRDARADRRDRDAGRRVAAVRRGVPRHRPAATPAPPPRWPTSTTGASAPGRMSKAFSLAGLRLGLGRGAARPHPRSSRSTATTTRSASAWSTTCSPPIALENADAILTRSRALTRDNLAILVRLGRQPTEHQLGQTPRRNHCSAASTTYR